MKTLFHLLDFVSPYTQILLILSIACYGITQFVIGRTQRRWRGRFREERRRRETAEAANKSKALFLTSMSHEIRTPLNAIVGFTDLALKTPLNPELREYLSTVRSSADWLTHVVKEIQDYSRMEAGMFQLCIDTFSLSETVRSAVNISQALADQRKLSLRFHLDAGLPKQVQGDSTRLLQVLFNLIENALKFTTSGGVLITAVLEQGAWDYATIRIAVADTGSGIPAERLKNLFDPLSDSAGKLDRRTRSCGFGLPICQRVVQMMGGEIEVQSRPGIGSTFAFTVTVPVVHQKSELEEPRVNRAQAIRPLQILLADSNAASRRLATVLLQGSGHSVKESAGGVEALNLFTEGRYDLVLVDDGIVNLTLKDVTRGIRAAEPKGQCVPIYALTTQISEADKKTLLEIGVTGQLLKPLRVETLLSLSLSVAAAKDAQLKSRAEPSHLGMHAGLPLLSTEAV